jgi:hypothetical protein
VFSSTEFYSVEINSLFLKTNNPLFLLNGDFYAVYNILFIFFFCNVGELYNTLFGL